MKRVEAHVVVCGLLFLAAQASAALMGTVTPVGGGRYNYQYTVNNLAGTYPISSWSLEFGFAIAAMDWNPAAVSSGGDVIVPLGLPGTALDDWDADLGIPIVGKSAQDFVALGPAGQADVAVGAQLSGFSFTSSYAPGTSTYYQYGPSGQTSFGTVVAPIQAPEPSTAVLLVFCGMGTLMCVRRRAAAS